MEGGNFKNARALEQVVELFYSVRELVAPPARAGRGLKHQALVGAVVKRLHEPDGMAVLQSAAAAGMFSKRGRLWRSLMRTRP